jgi:uncharacterized protein YhfF
VNVTEFAFPGELRDRLVAAVIRGEKTATSGLLAEYEHDRDEIPTAGARSRVLDSAGRPVAVIELTEVRIVRVGDVDLEFALDEGEDFQSVADWREAHERFWASYIPETLCDPEWRLSDDTLIVAERFRLIETWTDSLLQ